MNEYNISDYALFTESINIINKGIANINDNINSFQNTIKEMCTEDVFFGPIAESCLSGGNEISKAIRKPNSELAKSVFYLKLTSKKYESADSSNASRITSV